LWLILIYIVERATADHVALIKPLHNMEQPKPRPQRFYGYPRPVEAPLIPFTKSDDANPVFRGLLLVVGAWLFVTPPILNTNARAVTADFQQCVKTGLCPEILMDKCWVQWASEPEISEAIYRALGCKFAKYTIFRSRD